MEIINNHLLVFILPEIDSTFIGDSPPSANLTEILGHVPYARQASATIVFHPFIYDTLNCVLVERIY